MSIVTLVSTLYVCMYGQHFQQSTDQPRGMVADPALGQLNRENVFSPLSPFVPENLVSRDGFGRSVGYAVQSQLLTLPLNESGIQNPAQTKT